jgi:hypothetical protein
MAGKQAGFSAKDFRKNIRFVFDMAAPTVDGEQATFYFSDGVAYAAPVDQEDVAFDPHAAVQTTQVAKAPVKVSCGVEYLDAQGNPVEFGIVTPARARITMFDEDYAKVKGCIFVALRGERFNYRNTEYPQGLFDVALYTLNFTAVDVT